MNIIELQVDQKGFTLIELMVTLVVLSIGLLAIAFMQITAIHGNSFSNKMMGANQLGARYIEEINLMNYSKVVDNDSDGESGLSDNTAATADLSDLNVAVGGVGTTYDVFWNVATNLPGINTKTIRVIVTWLEEGQSRQVSFDFIKAQ